MSEEKNIEENIEEKNSLSPAKEKVLRGSYNLPKVPPNPPFKNLRAKAEQEKFLGFVAEGMTEKDSMALCGISYTKVRNWKLKDKQFIKDLWMAEQSFKLKHIRNIDRHSDMDWKASKFLLERKFKDEWGEKTFTQVEQVGGDKEAKFVGNLLNQILAAVSGQPTPTLAKPPQPTLPLSDPYSWEQGTDDEDDDYIQEPMDAEDPDEYETGEYSEDIDGDFDDGL